MTSDKFVSILKPICDKYRFTNNLTFNISYRGLVVLGLPSFFDQTAMNLREESDVSIILHIIQNDELQLSKLVENDIKIGEIQSFLIELGSCLNNINLPINVIFYNYTK
jgi:hypothetical protein